MAAIAYNILYHTFMFLTNQVALFKVVVYKHKSNLTDVGM